MAHNHAITIITNEFHKFWCIFDLRNNIYKIDPKWTLFGPEGPSPEYFLWNLSMRFYQYHPEGEIKPFQWVVSQNPRVGTGRLEPLGKTDEFCAMIRAQDNYPSRSDL